MRLALLPAAWCTFGAGGLDELLRRSDCSTANSGRAALGRSHAARIGSRVSSGSDPRGLSAIAACDGYRTSLVEKAEPSVLAEGGR